MKPYQLACILVMLAVSACSSSGVREEYSPDGKLIAREYRGGDPSYAQYVAAMGAQKQIGVDVVACNGDPTCVVAVAGFAAIGSGNRPNIAPPVPKRTAGDRLESITRAAISVLPGLGGLYVAKESAKESRHEREALYGTFAGFGANLAAAGSVPTYQVGGDMIGGDRISDSGNDNSTHGDTISDSGNTPTTVTGDGNATGDGNIANNGVWRDDSPDVYDDHCEAETGCGATITPPPEPIDPGT